MIGLCTEERQHIKDMHYTKHLCRKWKWPHTLCDNCHEKLELLGIRVLSALYFSLLNLCLDITVNGIHIQAL